MRRIDVLSIWYRNTDFNTQGNGGLSLNDFFLCSNPLMEISLDFLIELTHGGVFLQVFLFLSTLLYSIWLNWFMEVSLGWICLQEYPFLFQVGSREKSRGWSHPHDNHHSNGFPYLLTISMFLIVIFPQQRIRVSKTVFPLPLPLRSMDLHQFFSCFSYQWSPSSFWYWIETN